MDTVLDSINKVTEASQQYAAEAVKRGAALLDSRIPNWIERVNLIDLDVASCDSCVLGQVYEASDDSGMPSSTGWGVGMVDLFGDVDARPGVAYGFEQRGLVHSETLYPHEEYEILTDAWVNLIYDRRNG